MDLRSALRLATLLVLGLAPVATAQVVTCPADVTVANDPGQCGAVVNYDAPIPPMNETATCSPPSGSFFPVGTTIVTCTASGGSMCSFNVTVDDTEPPTITCGEDVSATDFDEDGSEAVSYAPPSTSDNCPGGAAAACVPPSGSSFPTGSTTVTCTASDVAGNTASCPFGVEVAACAVLQQDDDENGPGVDPVVPDCDDVSLMLN